ncbi:sestrin homolog isoform X1 [Phlebotomus papatasi]|uniref:sestrin homolog isoform X1 n=1 Tax=Phlebotomus papatasi TaxID=29031 RepID=UPI002483D709|nr:sestrin homolog isoform X1 [Phlebotomus papatasi]XP_055707535.1 sestrin homolog isoform X1 [Phlebotomus papatasi]XP_055707536.1 sestrin homolog isoform X1 [Phlebotomus papatasi]XP_055707537.1 sestrin homolog isoform X1 [Phlebotomus papatasi]XP_055707538.1 sestrin homolog isoform X1 [Phlebotomus papatasi]XP_055707539.1 sestrin homolog isoform X1 [Phlebotomus papatasi]XP_055707540.1 sestrin homolog isoform X1 [Phlebotomus papatasi]
MFSMVECYTDMGQIGQDYILQRYPMDKIDLDHVSQVIGYHPSYLEHFLKTQKFILYADGPLPYNYRNYLAIMAASRHQCSYLIELYEQEFLEQGGDRKWLEGLEYIPAKLRAIYTINKILAHRPWLLTTDHIEALTKGRFCWTLAEVVHAIVILAHFHSLSSFVFSCGLTQELSHSVSSQSRRQSGVGSRSPTEEVKSVDDLMARMRDLSSRNTKCSEDELSTRFKTVEMQAAELAAGTLQTPVNLPPKVCQYVEDAAFTYVDFAKRGSADMPTTFRVQDYSWDDHGYSLVNRLYNDVGYLLDAKFRAAYNLTYFTLAGRSNVDTSKFRRAIWNYIQCIYGIRHDDYDYGEVNQLLEKSLKMFIKTACCFPERITKKDYDSILRELQHSEKVHVNLMILEARNQAELLYALREIMRYMT